MVSYQGFLAQAEEDTKVKHISVLSRRGPLAACARFGHKCLYVFKPFRSLTSLLETFFTFWLASLDNKKQRYDAIHVLDASLFPLSFLAFASVIKNNTLVLTVSNPPMKKLRGSSRKETILTGLQEARGAGVLERFLYHRATRRNHIAFVCHAKQIQESYAGSLIHSKLACIPWGIDRIDSKPIVRDEARAHLDLPPGSKHFLSFGVNHPRKNFEVIFQAVQDLPRDFKLIFAGKIVPEDAPINDPVRFAQKYGWMGNTIIADKFIPDGEMPYYFAAADAIILSYRKDFIGASGVLSHSSTFQLPVIASDIGQLGEFVKEYKLGLTFTPEDASSLREAILSFLKLDEEARQTLKRNLAEFATANSWGAVASKHLELYRSLTDGQQDRS